MDSRESRQLWGGIWATGLGTLASRLLGLARDIVTAGLLGMSGGAMDALVVALRVPNLFRRIFGEGALAASFLPVFTAEHERSPRRGWQLASGLLVVLATVLGLVTLVGEAVCLAVLAWGSDDAAVQGVAGLTAILLPYLVLVCLAAQASAMLQSLMRYRAGALAPTLLNICWLAAALAVAPSFGADAWAQARVLAVAVVVSGVLQLGVLLGVLRRAGFRFSLDWRSSQSALRRVAFTLGPVALSLAVTQLNTLADSLIAWGLAAEPGGERTIGWLGHAVRYPLESGAAAAIYYGERFYQLPVGLLGVALATAIYPLLARHAARGQQQRLATDLGAGLRLAVFAALPAAVGMMLIAEPAVKMLFERGAFASNDAHRAATMIACYASGVIAYCALPLLVRGHYAAGGHRATARVAMTMVGLDLLLNLTLIWPLGERGLAVSTALVAMLQAGWLAVLFDRGIAPLPWRELATTFIKSGLATLAMAATVWPWLERQPAGSPFWSLVVAVPLGLTVYLGVCRLLGMREVAVVLVGATPNEQGDVARAPAA